MQGCQSNSCIMQSLANMYVCKDVNPTPDSLSSYIGERMYIQLLQHLESMYIYRLQPTPSAFVS